MIDRHYIDLKIRDYMDDEELKIGLSNDFIDCSLGTNPFINDDFMNKYLQNSNSEINKYPSIQYDLLKEELVNIWKESKVRKDNIAFGSGTMGMLRNICEITVQKGTKVLGIAPQFPRFVSEVELKRGIYEYYELNEKNNFKFDVDDFIRKIDSSFNLISIENPNNPTGQIIDIRDIEKIVIKAEEVDALVIIDEAYGDYMKNSNSAINLVSKYNNLIVLRSASKFYGLPNHRIGYLFSSKKFVKLYDKISLPFPFSDMSASIFINVLKDYKSFEFTKEKTITVKKKILESLDNNYIYTSLDSPIFTIRTDKYKNLKKELFEKGINAESCGYFIGLDDSYSRIRITDNYEKLIEKLIRIL